MLHRCASKRYVKRKQSVYTAKLSAVDVVADPSAADTFHVKLLMCPVAAHNEVVAVNPMSPAVHYPHHVGTADH